LGRCYAYGNGIAEDRPQAAYWFNKAIECWLDRAEKQNDADAQYFLGECYANGDGVEKDMENAVKWYRKAGMQRQCDAMKRLGFCYYFGDGVKGEEYDTDDVFYSSLYDDSCIKSWIEKTKTKLTKIEYDRTLINWTNVYFELFSMVFNKENSI
jgi:TPR repeat protein